MKYKPNGNGYVQGEYILKNPQKYQGEYPVYYRSSWERTVIRNFDEHPSVISWASESIKIPYKHPLRNGNIAWYIPDFLVQYQDKNGSIITELIEVKPLKETVLERAKTANDKLKVAVNMAKWTAAKAFCKTNNIKFRVISAENIYRNVKGK